MKILATTALAVLLALGAALAACGSDDDTQQQSAAQTEQQPEQQTVAAQPASAEPQADQEEPPTQQPADQQQEQQEGSSRAFGQRTTTQDDEDEAQQQAAAGDQSEQADQQAEQQQAQPAQDEPPAEQERQQQSAAEQTAQRQQAAEQVEAEEEQQASPPPQQQQAGEEEEQQAITVTLVDDDDDPPPELPAWTSAAAREAAAWSEAQLQARADEIAAAGSVAELVGLDAWLNGAATTIARELARGNVVLIDFWTYTCINCVRTFPFLKEWHAKYGDRGLTIIGVHSPEFEFEEEIANVRQAIEQYDIRYLVAQDNRFATWRAFNNRYWPAKYLIGPAMEVRYQHFGEGDYLETEHEIRAALLEAGWELSGVAEGTEAVAPQRDPVSRGQTRELYGGTRRNYGRIQYAAQPEYYLQAGVDQFYTDIEGGPRERENHRWYLQGLWRNEEEAIVHARTTEQLEDYLAFKFTARSVNVVLTVPEGGEPFNVYVELDGRWLTPQEAGADVRFDGEERSFVRVTKDDLYRLVVLPEWSTHELKLRSNSDQLAIFAFTFGSYLGGE